MAILEGGGNFSKLALWGELGPSAGTDGIAAGTMFERTPMPQARRTAALMRGRPGTLDLAVMNAAMTRGFSRRIEEALADPRSLRGGGRRPPLGATAALFIRMPDDTAAMRNERLRP